MVAVAVNSDEGTRLFDSLPERKSLGDSVYEKLRLAIVNGELPPGERLVESRMAQTFGISRTPIREAIHKLEREGLLQRDPKGGFFVMGLTREDIEETFGIRSVLESYAARLAAAHHREEDLIPLENKLVEYETALRGGDLAALPRINTEFHELLYALSRSPRLIKMIEDLKTYIFRFRHVILKVEEMARISSADHRSMLNGIRKRDEEKVATLVREHILRGREIVLAEFDKQRGSKENGENDE
jgi:DNA-binding GntR family transcriptional regulator